MGCIWAYWIRKRDNIETFQSVCVGWYLNWMIWLIDQGLRTEVFKASGHRFCIKGWENMAMWLHVSLILRIRIYERLFLTNIVLLIRWTKVESAYGKNSRIGGSSWVRKYCFVILPFSRGMPVCECVHVFSSMLR